MMSMLSDVDIARELGKNIFIYPLREDIIKNSSINLTISNRAWSLRWHKSIVEGQNIRIEAGDTALIETNETLHVSKKIGGTYHSRVSIAALGIGHIGTTLDPDWTGHSLIAVHNHYGKEISLKVGSEFTTLVLYYLSVPSSKANAKSNSRLDLLNQYELTEEDKIWLCEYSTPDDIKEQMCKSAEYKAIKSKYSNKTALGRYRLGIVKYAVALLILAMAILFLLFVDNSADSISKYVVAGFVGTLLTMIIVDIENAMKKR